MSATCKHGALLTEGCDDCGPVPIANPTPTQQGETLEPEPILLDRNDVLDALALFCAEYDSLGERFKKRLRIAIRAIPPSTRRAAVAGPGGDLGLDTNFPLSETLRLLVEWAQHLHVSHECDCDGWEQRSFLIEAAQRYRREIATIAAASPATPAEATCAKCGGSGEIEIGCAMDHALTAPCVDCGGKGTVVTAPPERNRGTILAAAPADSDTER